MDYIYLYPSLETGVLIKRYKRFLADVELHDGRKVTAFCPNSGSMMGLVEPGTPAMLSESDNPGRKTRYTLELLRPDRHWVGVNTHLTNDFAETLLSTGKLHGQFGPFTDLRREVRTGASRLDMVLTHRGGKQTFIEVKSVTLRLGNEARFPDAPTLRGVKHLNELIALRKKGHRAAMLYLVQRGDCRCFGPAEQIDPAYASAFTEALRAGVEVHPVELGARTRGIYLKGPMPHCG